MNNNKPFRTICSVMLLCFILNYPQIVAGQTSWNSLPVKTMEVNGITLHYIEEGTGTPVIFVHGSFGDYRTWHYQIEPFAKHYRAISYSRRYYFPNAKAADSADFSSNVDVNDLASFIKKLHAGPVWLVGHSAGGWVALAATICHPELVKGLVLGEPPVSELLAGDTTGQALMQKAVSAGYMPAVKAFQQNEDRKAAKIFLGVVTGNPHFLENLSPLDRRIMQDNVATEKRIFLSERSKTQGRPVITCQNIKKLSMPVLLVSGADTPEWLSHLSDRLTMCVKDCERVTLRHTSHGLEFTNPEGFNKAVLRYMDKYEN